MNNFSLLTRNKQIYELRKAAKEVIGLYGFEDYRLSLLQHAMNTVFQLRTFNMDRNNDDFSHQPYSKDKYVIRIQPPEWLNYDYIEAEMKYLLDLRSKTGLPVSEPVAAKDGSLVQKVTLSNYNENRHCAIFKWVDGVFRKKKLTTSELTEIGKFIAKVHNFSCGYINDTKYHRPLFNWEGFLGEKGIFYSGIHSKNYSKQDLDVVNKASAMVRERLENMEINPQSFGFIQGDFYFRNILFKNGEARVIDFDLCGYGYYLYDLAIPYWPQGQGDTKAAMLHVISGYRQIRKLEEGFEKDIPHFLALRRLIDAEYMIARVDDKRFDSFAKQYISWAVNELKYYIDQYS